MSGSESAAERISGKEPEEVMRVAFSSDGSAYQPIPDYQNLPPQQSALDASPAFSVPLPRPAFDSVKRKRGRPRMYGPDATISPPPQNQSGHPAPSPRGNSNGGGSSAKKPRGRGPNGVGFTPHIITVGPGEDVSSKIMSFSQHGPRAVCILSANGAISNVTVRQSASSGGTVTYEGRFDIVSLTGSFILCERGGQKSRAGGLNVSFTSADGRILGGGVAGLLIAASPIQIIAGSFTEGKKEPKSINQVNPSGTTSFASSGSTGPSSSPLRGTLGESSGGAATPLNQNTGTSNNNNNAQGIPSRPWN